jgi:glycerol-3-phosphate acyltransferase PlsY
MSVAFLTGLLLAWLLGSLPTAYLVGRAHGVDLRTVGSGNLGATNALRTLGWRAGLLVYFVDTLKGALPVALLPRLLPAAFDGPAHVHWGMAFGLAAILGHVRPVFLRGKGGGKGVATASGVFLALVPLPALAALGAFLVTAAITRYISLASLVGALALTSATAIMYGPRAPSFGVAAVVTAFVFWTHRENIARLRLGTERRLGGKASPDTSSPGATSSDAPSATAGGTA